MLSKRKYATVSRSKIQFRRKKERKENRERDLFLMVPREHTYFVSRG